MNSFKGIASHYVAHLIPILLIAGPLSYMQGDLMILAAASLFGVLIDTDHLVDYWLSPVRTGFNWKEALGCRYFEKATRVYLPLHSYDLHIAIAAVLMLNSHASLAYAWSTGFIVHIMTDEFLGHSQGTNPFRNFLIYRILNRFDSRLYCGETA